MASASKTAQQGPQLHGHESADPGILRQRSAGGHNGLGGDVVSREVVDFDRECRELVSRFGEIHLIEIAPGSTVCSVPPLEPVALNHGFARAVVEELVAGRLWVDRQVSPRAAHVLHPYGMSLIWGEELASALEPLLQHLRAGGYRTGEEWLQVDPRWDRLGWDELLGAIPADAPGADDASKVQRHWRVNFRFDAVAFSRRHQRPVLPLGWQVRPISRREFDLPGVGVTPHAFWPDASRFLTQGLGWCAERDGEVGAIAFSAFHFDGQVEIGLETMTAHRGKGLGLAVAVAMIGTILEAGLEPVWACRKENTASLELARKLGFAAQKLFPYYRLPRVASPDSSLR